MELVLTLEENENSVSIPKPDGYAFECIKNPAIKLDGILQPLQYDDYGNICLTYDGRQIALISFERTDEFTLLRQFSIKFEKSMITVTLVLVPFRHGIS